MSPLVLYPLGCFSPWVFFCVKDSKNYIICICVCILVCLYLCVCNCACVLVCLYLRISACLFVFVYVYLCVCICVFVLVCLFVCLYICAPGTTLTPLCFLSLSSPVERRRRQSSLKSEGQQLLSVFDLFLSFF